jgi:hypothetical protein
MSWSFSEAIRFGNVHGQNYSFSLSTWNWNCKRLRNRELECWTPYCICNSNPALVILGGVMVSVLAILPKVFGFNPSWRQQILRAIKTCSTPYFGGVVKPLAPCHKILWHVKQPSKMNKDTSSGQIHHFLTQFLLLCYQMTLLVRLPQSCGVCKSGVFPCWYHTTMVLHAHLSPAWPQFRDII